MDSKVCTYTEKNNRLQLVFVKDDGEDYYEIRLNRSVISRIPRYLPVSARLAFVHSVNEICVNRSTTMLKLTL